jgi:hypothetical protein
MYTSTPNAGQPKQPLRLPVQTVPIDRTSVGLAELSDASGAEPCFDWSSWQLNHGGWMPECAAGACLPPFIL